MLLSIQFVHFVSSQPDIPLGCQDNITHIFKSETYKFVQLLKPIPNLLLVPHSSLVFSHPFHFPQTELLYKEQKHILMHFPPLQNLKINKLVIFSVFLCLSSINTFSLKLFSIIQCQRRDLIISAISVIIMQHQEV